MRWEYKRVPCEPNELQEGEIDVRLAELGNEGWELVTSVQKERHGHTSQLHLFFKRPLG